MIFKSKRTIVVNRDNSKEDIMKTFSIGSLLIVLSMSLFIGCGGGSGGGDTPTAAATSTLTSKNVNDFAKKISDKFGCQYTENAATKASLLRKESLFSAVVESTVHNLINAKLNQGLRLLRATSTETTNGDCGGKLLTTTNEDTGSIYFDFQNYCNGEVTGERTVINGSLDTKVSAKEGLMLINASTRKTLNVVTTNPDNEKVDASINIDSAVITIKGTVSLDNLEALDVSVSVKSGSITDNTTGLGYSGKNLKATYKNAETEFSATFTDPELGTVNVSGYVDKDKKATINLVGSGGSNAKFTATSQEGVYGVSSNGEEIGVMDCPTSDDPSLEALFQ
jgi:hypothetical protein